MEPVGLHVDKDRDLTVITLSGLLEIEQVRHLIQRPEFGTTTRLLWDCRETSFANITRESLTSVAREQVPVVKHHVTRRVAVVVPTEDVIPFARLYFEIARHQFDRKILSHITTDMAAARHWLDHEDNGADG